MDIIKLYFAFGRINFLRQTQYRKEYAFRMIFKSIYWGSLFLMLYVLLNSFGSIGVWSMYEVMFLYSFNVLSYSIAGTFFITFEGLATRIHSGDFDAILTKPVNPFAHYMVNGVSAGYVNNFIICGIVMWISLSNMTVAITPARVLYFFAALAGGVLIHAAAFVITNVPAFWLIKNSSIQRLFYDQLGRGFMEYPISIYHRALQIMLTFILPYAFISFYPVQFLLGKDDLLGFPTWIVFLTPLVGAALFGIGYLFWNMGINHYKSTGS